jgi:hypothetical protein
MCETDLFNVWSVILMTTSEKRNLLDSISHDPVNHPSHYCQDGQMECIDEMVMFFGKEVVKHFCLCNAWKYRYRANSKNGKEDLKKAAWYVHKYRELNNNDRSNLY